MTILALAVAPATAATKVFLLGGQSNMDGRAPADDLSPPYDQPQTEVKYWSGGGWVDLQGGFSTDISDCFGPEVSFGYALREIFPNDDVFLVEHSQGSTNLAVHWSPDGTGEHYNALKSAADAALQDLTTSGLSPAVAGMIWMQGEADAMDGNYAAAYATNLTNLIAKLRDDFAAPDARFVVGRITTYYGTTANNTLVRLAQETVAEQVSNTAWIDTDDLSWQDGRPGHYGAEGQIELGIRFANEVPEPSTLVLLTIGLIGLLCHAWRKRK
ncbi:MAG: sialate O-acetylesterase [Pirellulales bacterium]|nr:sialate O-acetylesterase [Pirellulales bacterium]